MTSSNPSEPNAAMAQARESATPAEGAPLAELAEFFEIQAALQRLSERTTDVCQSSSGAITRQRGEIDALSEWLRRLETSLREARNHVETLGVAFDRIKIVALNTGLEGARLGDLAGKALISVSDELRNLTTRGLELLAEQAATVEQMEADRQRLVTLSERSRSHLGELDAGLREALSAEHSTHQTLSRFASALQKATGLDVEAAAQLSRISAQARGLVDSLTGLSKPEHQNAVRVALTPALAPLVAWLSSSPDPKP